MSGKLWPKTVPNNCVGVAHIIRPHLDYRASAVQTAKSVRKSSFIVYSINIHVVYLKAVESSKELFAYTMYSTCTTCGCSVLGGEYERVIATGCLKVRTCE